MVFRSLRTRASWFSSWLFSRYLVRKPSFTIFESCSCERAHEHLASNDDRPSKMIIWALNSFRWLSGSSTQEKRVIFGLIKWGGIGSSMIWCENGLGSSLEDMFGERVRTLRRSCLCMFLHNSLFVLRNSSLARAFSSIVLRETSISSMRRTWLIHVSSCRRSWWARVFSLSRSCSA